MVAVEFDGSQEARPPGHYTYHVADDRWTWSDEVYELHGYDPGEVRPTTSVLLQHKHPDDRTRTFEVLEAALATGRAYSCYHRIIDRRGRVRSVLAVGRGTRTAPDGGIEELAGYFIDLTEVRRDETEAEVEVALARIAEHRSVIDQAKGMLMAVEGCDADRAFELLRIASANSNIKLHTVAHQLVALASGAGLRRSEELRTDVLAFLEGLHPGRPTAVPASEPA